MNRMAALVPQLTTACPYCFVQFRRREIPFQCRGRPTHTGKQCVPQDDAAYAALFGSVPQLPVFPARGLEPACPQCDGRTTYRVCPHCHHRLPEEFTRVRSRMVAVVGSRSSGKTAMLAVLITALNEKDGERLGLQIWPADDETVREFDRNYERSIYGATAVVPAPTVRVDATGQEVRAPLVYVVARSDQKGRRTRRTLLSFFDTAGEDLQTEEGVRNTLRYVRSADAVLFVVDPLQTAEGRQRTPSPEEEVPAADDRAIDVLRRITQLIVTGKRRLEVRKPLAVAMSKIDRYWDEMSPTDPLRRPEPQVNGYAAIDGEQVHDQVERLLRRWDGRRIPDFLASNYRRYQYFGFSALGHTPDRQFLSETGPLPYRVAGPFVWLLSEIGAVPVVKDA